MGGRQVNRNLQQGVLGLGKEKSPGHSWSPDSRKFAHDPIILTFLQMHSFHTIMLYCVICLFPLCFVFKHSFLFLQSHHIHMFKWLCDIHEVDKISIRLLLDS